MNRQTLIGRMGRSRGVEYDGDGLHTVSPRAEDQLSEVYGSLPPHRALLSL